MIMETLSIKKYISRKGDNMNTIDMRFDNSLIQGWIGKAFEKYKCDQFDFTNSVTQIVGLFIDNNVYTMTNIQETVDYFGNTDDIAVCRISESTEEDIKSALKDSKMIFTPVNGTISKIRLVNENQQIFESGDVSYDVWITRAIIFFVDGREISFEKDNIPFSEEIIIRKGYDLYKKCSDENAFLEGWDEGIIAKCTRHIVDITSDAIVIDS